MTTGPQKPDVTPTVPEDIANASPLAGAPLQRDAIGLRSRPSEPLTEIHRDFASFQQGYVWNAISLADAKATWTFAICGGVIAYLLASTDIATEILNASWSVGTAVTIVALLGLIVGAAFAFFVIFPRLSASGGGVVYFAAVAGRCDANAYVDDVSALDQDELTRARLMHAYDISRIARRKYRHLQKSMVAAVCGLIAAAMMVASGWVNNDSEAGQKPVQLGASPDHSLSTPIAGQGREAQADLSRTAE